MIFFNYNNMHQYKFFMLVKTNIVTIIVTITTSINFYAL